MSNKTDEKKEENLMIDFKTTIFQTLALADNDTYSDILNKILVNEEWISMTFKGYRDGIVFTDKRIIAINIQGLSGKKKDVTSIPYSKIQSFSVETNGGIDIDSELTIWIPSVGSVRFQFLAGTDVFMINRALSDFCLN